jgi:hypothetical protein
MTRRIVSLLVLLAAPCLTDAQHVVFLRECLRS